MNAQDKSQEPDKARQQPSAPTEASPPPVNPETDHESVDKGKDQLDKVSGN